MTDTLTQEQRQAMFDKVAKALIAQGHPSMAVINGTLICAYRGDQGAKCAAGHLIPNRSYRKFMEGESVNGPGVQAVIPQRYRNFHLLMALQDAHDTGYGATPSDWVGEFKGRMRYVAEQFGLDATVVM